MIIHPFQGPRLKVRRAYNHLRELHSVMSEYEQRLNIHYEPTLEDKTLAEVHFSEQPPECVPLIIGDTAHNLRSALDIMICDIARVQGKSSQRLKFPFAETPEKYEEIISNGEVRRLGDDVQKYLRSLKAYKDGNTDLRGLHDLDILDKHVLVIPTFTLSWAEHDMARLVLDGLRETDPDKAANINLVYAGGGIATTTLLGHRDKISIGSDGRPYAQHVAEQLTVLFAQPGHPFSGQHVLKTLHHLVKVVDQIVEAVARQFGGGNLNATARHESIISSSEGVR
jgi:hypothetical protein